MFTSAEKMIIQKNYNEYEGNNLWNFYKKKDKTAYLTLRFDIIRKTYVFSFPLNNSKYNYQICINDLDEAKNYIDYVVNNYL